MTGLDAISAYNGWSMAAVGISIVFTGLVILALTIAQLHKILAFWENRDQFYARFRKKKMCIVVPEDIQESARNFKMLADRMAEPLSLPKLLESAVRCGVENPHSTLDKLILSNIIVPDGEGCCRWNKNARI